MFPFMLYPITSNVRDRAAGTPVRLPSSENHLFQQLNWKSILSEQGDNLIKPRAFQRKTLSVSAELDLVLENKQVIPGR